MANADFVWHREDILEVYTRPYDPKRPQVCRDETSRQLLADTYPSRPALPGQPAQEAHEYVRQGVCNLFMMCGPLRGWRHVTVSDRRTRLDWAQCSKELVDVHYPDAERIVLVQDNLNTPRTRPLRATRPLPRWRPSGLRRGWSGITRPSRAVGWIGRRLNSVCWPVNAGTGGCPTASRWNAK